MSDDAWRPPGWEDEPEPQPSQPPGWEQQPGGPPPGWGRPPGGTQWGQPQYGYRRQTEGTAVAVLVLGILSWVFIACGGAILAVVALALIPNSRRKIASSQGMLDGEGFLTAGKWLSISSLGLTVLGIALLIFLLIIGAMFDSSGTQTEFGLLLSALR